VGWGKVACWSTKAAISLKCIKIDEKLLWRAYRNSPTLFRTVPSPTPYSLPFHKKLFCNIPNPKLQSLLSQERLKLCTANLAGSFTGSIRTKAHEKFGRKGSVAYPGTAQVIGVPAIMSGTGKATNFKFCTHIHRINRNKSPLQILGKVAVDVLRNSRKCSGHWRCLSYSAQSYYRTDVERHYS